MDEKECHLLMQEIAAKFKLCRKVITAIGDETRQQILLALLEGDLNGMRVGEITGNTSLSRPAVSHHLQILKDAEIINLRRTGTKNYYYLSPQESKLTNLADLMNLILAGIRNIEINNEKE